MKFENYVWRYGNTKTVAEIVAATGRTREEVQIAYDKALYAHRNDPRAYHTGPVGGGRRWTNEEVDELLRLRKEGWTNENLAVHFNRTKTSVRNKISSLLLFTERKWTGEEEKKLLELRASGLSWRAIARELDKSENGCLQKWRRLTGCDKTK